MNGNTAEIGKRNDVWLAMGRPNDAVFAYLRALEAPARNVSDVEIKIALAQALTLTGNMVEARETWEQVLEIEPGNLVPTDALKDQP